MPVMVPPYQSPVGAPSADNGYSIENIRVRNEVCPVCRHEDPAPPRRSLHGGALRELLAAELLGDLVSGDYDDDPELWLSRLGAELVTFSRGETARGAGALGLRCTCSACGHHYAPDAYARWLDAVEALATRRRSDPSRAGARRTGAPGDDRAAGAHRLAGADAPRLAAPLDGPGSLAGDTLIELLGRIEDLDERVHQAEQTTAATVQALADERRARRDAIDGEARKQAEITTATTGVLLELREQIAELVEDLPGVLLELREQIGRAGEQIEALRGELASLHGYVKALEERADAADQTRNDLRELEDTARDHEDRIVAVEQVRR